MFSNIFDIVKERDCKRVDFQLALQCAPVISGVKISNLLTFPKSKMDKLDKILLGSELAYKIIYPGGNRLVALVYRKNELTDYILETRVRDYFKTCGYEDISIDGIMPLLITRYIKFMEVKKNFPHELGLLLGYPIEDVEGFVKNEGKNFVYSGYWKVYKDVETKIELFETYRRVQLETVRLLCEGFSLSDIIENYSSISRRANNTCVTYL